MKRPTPLIFGEIMTQGGSDAHGPAFPDSRINQKAQKSPTPKIGACICATIRDFAYLGYGKFLRSGAGSLKPRRGKDDDKDGTPCLAREIDCDWGCLTLTLTLYDGRGRLRLVRVIFMRHLNGRKGYFGCGITNVVTFRKPRGGEINFIPL